MISLLRSSDSHHILAKHFAASFNVSVRLHRLKPLGFTSDTKLIFRTKGLLLSIAVQARGSLNWLRLDLAAP
jgi:hypothetical protein